MQYGSQLINDVKINHVTVDGTNYVLAAGTSDVNTGIIDTRGFGGIAFLVQLGVMAASSGVTIKVKQSAASDMTGEVDVEGTSQTGSATDDDKMIGTDIFEPSERYVRLNIVRADGGDATINAVYALQYNPIEAPVTQSTGAGQFVRTPEKFQRPAAGTA
jgi:hypothetical protein